ncbi:MAG: hypothetical protein IPP25_13595 [Saprospiraceae bacterium]|nr:hypothetical protein [Candidatus Opimibacter skivensis]
MKTCLVIILLLSLMQWCVYAESNTVADGLELTIDIGPDIDPELGRQYYPLGGCKSTMVTD